MPRSPAHRSGGRYSHSHSIDNQIVRRDISGNSKSILSMSEQEQYIKNGGYIVIKQKKRE